MPTGRPKCPVCQGKGTITENAQEYEFITRDPITEKCMICNGTGILNPSTKLPNGKRAFEVFRKENGTQMTGSTGSAGSGKRLNVSKKAAINPEAVDTGVGYQPGMGKPGVESPKEAYEKPMFLEMALNPRLNKVLASGKMFLIVTETEPYYLDVYRMIRYQEQTQGTWTGSDEQGYVEALEDEIQRLKNMNISKRQDDASTMSKTRKEAING